MFQTIAKLFTNPQEYWSQAVSEPGDIKSQLVPKMALLAAIPAVASFLGLLLGFMRFSFGAAIVGAVVTLLLTYVLQIAIWIAFGFIIDGLAPSFGAQRDIGQSMKLATGATIPMWLGSALNITTISALGWVGWLAGLGYGAYVLYLGLPIMNGTAKEKAVGYTAASIGIMFVVGIIAGVLVGCPTSCLVASALTSSLPHLR